MAEQNTNAHLLCGLPCALHSIFKEASPDTFSRPLCMDSQTTQYSYRNGIRHVSLYAPWHLLVRYSTCSQGVIANDILLFATHNEPSGGALPMVLACSINQPLGKVRRCALEVVQPMLVVKQAGRTAYQGLALPRRRRSQQTPHCVRAL